MSISHRFRLATKVFEGTHADVFRASQQIGAGLDRTVALKVLAEHATAERRGLFAAEAKLLADLGHPHVPALIDFDPDAERPYLALAWIEGGSLAERLQGRVRPTLEGRLHLAHQLACVVADLHQRGVLHGDLTPENTLVDDDGHLWLIDFERAAALRQHRAAEGPRIEGQPAFLAPEVRLGKEFDAPADVFGLGATLAFIGSGARIFDSRAHLDRLLSGLAVDIPQSVPEPLRPWVEACCDPVARRRPSAAEVAEALGALAPPPRRGHAMVRDWTRESASAPRAAMGPRAELLLAHVDPAETTPAQPEGPRTAVSPRDDADAPTRDASPALPTEPELALEEGPTEDQPGLRMPAPVIVHRTAPGELPGLEVELEVWARGHSSALIVPSRWRPEGRDLRVQFEVPQGGSLESLQASLRMQGKKLSASDVDALVRGLLAAFITARRLRHRMPAPLAAQPWSMSPEHVHLGIDGQVRLGLPAQTWAAEGAARPHPVSAPALLVEYRGFVQTVRRIVECAPDATPPPWLDAPVRSARDAESALRVLIRLLTRRSDEVEEAAAAVRRLALFAAVAEAPVAAPCASAEPRTQAAPAAQRAPSLSAPTTCAGLTLAPPTIRTALWAPAMQPSFAGLARGWMAGLAATTAAAAFITYFGLR